MSNGREGFVPNPVFAGLVGICPLIAASRSLAEGLVYGLGAALCAIGLGLVVPPLKSVIAERLQAPTSLALSAAFALIYVFCARLYSPVITDALWIYLPLLAVNGLSITTINRLSLPGRFGLDGGSGLGGVALESLLFFLTAAFFGALRETSGLGTITLPSPGISPAHYSLTAESPLRIMISPAGGFILAGFLVAGYRLIVRRKRRIGT